MTIEAIEPGSSDLVMQLGIGCVVILVLDRVVNIVRLLAGRPRNAEADAKTGDEMRDKISDIHTRTRDLHNWHDQRDTDGVFLWNVPRSLEKSISRLTQSIEQNTQANSEQKQILLTLQRIMAQQQHDQRVDGQS